MEREGKERRWGLSVTERQTDRQTDRIGRHDRKNPKQTEIKKE